MWGKIRRDPAICVVLFGLAAVLLGFAREQAVAAKLGVSLTTDAFYLASALILFIPSLVNGACQGILAPQFSRRLLQSGPEAGKKLLEQLLFIIVGLGVAAAVLQLFVQGLAYVLWSGHFSARTSMTMSSSAWLAFSVPALCFSTAGIAALNVLGRYWVGAASSAIAPLVATMILYLPNPSASSLAIGVVLGLNIQALILAWALAREGVVLSRRPTWLDAKPILRDLTVVAFGVTASAASPLAIQAVVASLGDSELTTYTLGTKITVGFLGLSALIMSSILTPLFSARASGLPYSRVQFRAYMWLTAFAAASVTVFLMACSEQVIEMFLGHALAPAELERVAQMQFYAALQIPAFTLLFLGIRAVQAYHDVRFVSLMNWVQGFLMLGLASILHPQLGLLGIIVAVALAYALSGFCYLLKYRRMRSRSKQMRQPPADEKTPAVLASEDVIPRVEV